MSKLSKDKLAAVIISAIIAAAALSLIITNFFIPVKYLKSYTVSGSRADRGVMRVSFLDTGSVVAELPDGKNMLIDGGDGSFSDNSKILKSLNEKNIDTIDYLLCTSVNKERCGGLAEILKYKQAEKIYMPYAGDINFGTSFSSFKKAVENKEVIYNEYSAGESGSGWFFKILSPSALGVEGEYNDLLSNPSNSSAKNNSSAVVWLEYAGAGILLLSDVEADVLKRICEWYDIAEEDFAVNLKNCKVLSLGYGAKKSLYTPFYELLKPEISIISASNTSSEEVISEVSKYGELYEANITLTVDENGTIIKE